jgi:putative FmdB family regulatory protein
MPLYEFKCPKCGSIYEKLQMFEDKAPRCALDDSQTDRIVSRSSFVLKGPGWYKDGYSKGAPE